MNCKTNKMIWISRRLVPLFQYYDLLSLKATPLKYYQLVNNDMIENNLIWHKLYMKFYLTKW